MSPHYRTHGKIQIPLTPEDFNKILDTGHFVHLDHKAFFCLLYYFGIRKTEGLRAVKEQFTVKGQELFFDVGKRLKRGKHTPPLNLPLDKPGALLIWRTVEKTKPGARVWPYSAKTGYNIVARVLYYPHHLRLSRITNFFSKNFSITQVRSYTGLTLQSLESYVGIVDIQKMGRKAE